MTSTNPSQSAMFVSTERLLSEHREKLESLTERLMAKETLDMDEAYEAAGVPRPRPTELQETVA